MGDSRGHLTRALIMAGELAGHELLFVGGGCAEELRALGHRVHTLPMPETILANNRVDTPATAANFLRLMLGKGAVLRSLARELERFKPDLAVTDYEFYLPRAARLLGLPCVGFGHQHVLTRCDDTLPPGKAVSRLTTTAAIRLLFSVPERYLVTSFFPARPKGPDTQVLPALLRPDVPGLAPQTGEHVLAYFRSGVEAGLLEALAATGREVRLYGQGERPGVGRLRFLPASRERFLEDLAGCAYAVSSGGHNLLSEALCLGKPVLAVPADMFYEQFVNAWHLRRLGFGDFYTGRGGAGQAVAGFEARLGEYAAKLAGRSFLGNAEAASALEGIIGQAQAGRRPSSAGSRLPGP